MVGVWGHEGARGRLGWGQIAKAFSAEPRNLIWGSLEEAAIGRFFFFNWVRLEPGFEKMNAAE